MSQTKKFEQIAEQAALTVLRGNNLPETWSDPLLTLGFEMGEGIEYEEALRQFARAAIEADRAQLLGSLDAARHAIDLSRDAAEGDSNDAEIEILQDVRNRYQQIIEAVGGEWSHEPNAAHMECDGWPHTTEDA